MLNDAPDLDASAADPPIRSLSEAFREAYESAGLSQMRLAALTGLDQSLISKYALGKVQPPVNVLPLVDAACGRPRGHVLKLAGLVEDTVDTAAAILTDTNLRSENRQALLLVYDGLRRLDD